MLRPILVLGGTAAGLAAILSFKTHPAAVATPAPMPASPMPTAKQSAAHGSANARQPVASRVIAGAAESTQFGPMQVEVALTGKRITDVKVLRQTTDGPVSRRIDATSIPKLNSETLAAQSARIDTVSGATYTSEGYKQSLQSALDKA